jgi:hypothetical protein
MPGGPRVAAGLTFAAIFAALALLLARHHAAADVGIVLCSVVMLAQGAALAVDWRGSATVVHRWSAGGSSALASAYPMPVVRFIGALLVLVGVAALYEGIHYLAG